jgi:hypothetical protein
MKNSLGLLFLVISLMLCGFGKSLPDCCEQCKCENDNSKKEALMKIDPVETSIPGLSNYRLNEGYELKYTNYNTNNTADGTQEIFELSLLNRDGDTLCTKNIIKYKYNFYEPFCYCDENGELIIYLEFYDEPATKGGSAFWPSLRVQGVWQRSETE